MTEHIDETVRGTGDGSRRTGSRLSFLLQSFWMIAALSAASVFNVLFVSLVGRFLPDSQIGVFFCAWSILLLAAAPGGAVQTHLAGRFAEIAPEEERPLFAAWLRRLLIAGAVCAALFAVASPFLRRLLRFESVWPVIVTGVTVGFYAPVPLFYGRLQGRQQFTRLGAVMITEAGVRPVAALALSALALLSGTSSIAALTLGFFLGAAAAAPFTLVKRRQTDVVPASAKERELPAVLVSLLALAAFSYLDVLFVQHFHGHGGEGPGALFGATGTYGAASYLGRAFLMITLPLTLVMYPRVKSARLKGLPSRPFLRDTAVMALSAWAFGGTACAAAPGAITRALFPELPQAAELVRWFPVAIVPYVILTVLTYYNLACGRRRIAWFLAVGVALQWPAYVLYHDTLNTVLTVFGVTGGIAAVGLAVYTLVAEIASPPPSPPERPQNAPIS